MDYVRTELPDGCYHIRHENGDEYWCDANDHLHRENGPARHDNDGFQIYCHHGKLSRLDGPAMIYPDGRIVYLVNGVTPRTILDIVIIREEIDNEMFPSAELISNLHKDHSKGLSAYRITNSDELVLAILRYG